MLGLSRNYFKVRLRGLRLKFTFWYAVKKQPFYRRWRPSDIGFLYFQHPVITPFLVNISKRLQLPIHFLQPGEDCTPYRKIIIPNGMWPEIRAATEAIPLHKRVYCEVGFFPQNKNVYFDDVGVHGRSSVRQANLHPLKANEAEKLAKFREFYTAHNFIKVRWDTVVDQNTKAATDQVVGQSDFIFVPLQLETDTAFELCPFDDNQQMIDAIEGFLPGEKIIFKLHPLDKNTRNTVADKNILLAPENRDLRFLLIHAKSVISSNSTVMLEALLYGKKCASLGTGFNTGHHVSLECQDDTSRLTELNEWEADTDKVDQFLYFLLTKQISTNFWETNEETDKLVQWLKQYQVLPKGYQS
ncbi:hypothetical protein EY643_01695 [Halioglobus maricola]|uniref:Capsular biosynthesis protein n=1 Tax=Halioglobus maricola TaxID=2601894 RepID=A0A5P9NG15_9GAMM|nr:hypothetical protein [Halioglobus maricola]QFU74469.1 hypothetical protein EY643_01695 [Halioglobus maricola]